MRSILLGAASIAALLIPATANAQTGGYIDLSAGQLNVDGDDLTDITLGGAAAADLSDNWRAQFDVAINRYSESGDAFTLTDTAAHVYYQADNWAAGAVLSNIDFGFASSWGIGAEGQVQISRVVLEGEVGFGTIEAFGDNLDTTSANADATYYFTDNFSAGVNASYFDSDDAFGTVTSFGIEGEYKFDGSANSVFASYDNTNYDDIGGLETDAWRIGFRHAFGDDSLLGRRQTGPRWLGVRNPVSILGFGPSDRRLKRDITLLTTLENGMQLYAFRYLWSDVVYVGLMAQDLLWNPRWRSAVVKQANGFYAVNYTALGLRMTTLEEWQVNGRAAVICPQSAHADLRAAA